MSERSLQVLAEAAGLSADWENYAGTKHTVADPVLEQILHALEIPCATAQQRRESLALLNEESAQSQEPLITAVVGQAIPLHRAAAGRYRLELEDGTSREGRLKSGAALPEITTPGYHKLMLADAEPLTLAVAPPRCFGIRELGDKRRLWGLTAQIPSLYRAGDGGIGDFGSVAALAVSAAQQGADAIAISPVHALFGAQSERFGPYSPSTRLLRNPLLADPAAVFGTTAVRAALAESGLSEEFAELEAFSLIDVQRSARAKAALFRTLYERLESSGLRGDFDAFVRDAGPALHEHACFEALHRHFLARDPSGGHWRDWPAAYREPGTGAVMAFAQEHAQEIEFHSFVQWLTARSLARAQSQARDAGMAIGLIGDLAVGTDDGGSHAWSHQHDMLMGLHVGAPPDLLNNGQDWGLTAFSPRALKQHGYSAFLELLRASLCHVGGIRLDHILALQRLWLIPAGSPPDQGAYLQYPLTDLLRLVALESWRHRALVIGEDLGTVPDGFQEAISAAGVLGMRVLWFERKEEAFKEPSLWTPESVAMTTTHDLPTVSGWWAGRDIAWRKKLGRLEPGADEIAASADRERERSALWDAFTAAGLASASPPSSDEGVQIVSMAAAFIGSTPAELALLPVEDALALVEQPNIPGTLDEHPNWRRRLPCEVGDALGAPEVRARLAALSEQRQLTALPHAGAHTKKSRATTVRRK